MCKKIAIFIGILLSGNNCFASGDVKPCTHNQIMNIIPSTVVRMINGCTEFSLDTSTMKIQCQPTAPGEEQCTAYFNSTDGTAFELMDVETMAPVADRTQLHIGGFMQALYDSAGNPVGYSACQLDNQNGHRFGSVNLKYNREVGGECLLDSFNR